MVLTEEEKQEVERYNSFSKEEKDSYLEHNGVIILNINNDTDDGKVELDMEIKNEYHVALMKLCKDGEDVGDVLSRILSDYVNEVKNNEKT